MALKIHVSCSTIKTYTLQNILENIMLETKVFIEINENSFIIFSPTALKSPKPAAEPAPAITTAPVTTPVVGKKAGIYNSSMLLIEFFSVRYLNT